MKINVKEPVKFVLKQTGELVEFEKGKFDIEESDLRTERIIAQSDGKIEIIEEKGKKDTAGTGNNQDEV
jgi:hypothetical protein|nr:MAG TPA: hypothetical protein [Caudoviricetes sp.]